MARGNCCSEPASLVQIESLGRYVNRVGAEVASWPFIKQPFNYVNTFHQTGVQALHARFMEGWPNWCGERPKILVDKRNSIFTS
jgi:hypothetical protein